MISEESKAKVENLIRFSSGVFNEKLPADFYIYFHPTLHLFDSFDSWSAEENRIKNHNFEANRILNSRIYALKKQLKLGNSPALLTSLTFFDKKVSQTSGTFKVGVTNSSPKLTKEEREYLNEFKQAAKKIGYRRYKVQFSRDRDHKMHGWTKVKNLKLNQGRDALELERKVLHWVREELGLRPHLTKKHLPQSGWTETIDASKVELSDLWAKVREFSKEFK